MKLFMIAFVLMGAFAHTSLDCSALPNSVSRNYNETIAHCIHSLNVPGLKLFNANATIRNNIPTVNHDLREAQKVLRFAPDLEVGSDFTGATMNLIDLIMSNIGGHNDGLGDHWTPVERIAHRFHMLDLWHTILPVYNEISVPSTEVCACLTNTDENGIFQAVSWVANHYESGKPITLLGLPIPTLTDSKTWAIWKDRLLHYYDATSIRDAAMYLKCQKF